ncbi:MAG: MBL fold metallo-hydrolase [Nitrososphaerota archaeon]
MLHLDFKGGPRFSKDSVSLAFDSGGGPSTLTCISHAHSDHVVNHDRAVMSPETRELISCRGFGLRHVVTVRNGSEIKVGDNLTLRLLDAGHVLGSSQFQVEADGSAVTYTGDINTYETVISSPAEAKECDTLIIESTYGSPYYNFPPRETLYGEILGWISRCISTGDIPALKCYSIGKSQEIIKLVNEYTSLPVVVGSHVAVTSRVYVGMGVGLEFVPAGSSEGAEVLKSGGCVYVDSMRRRPLVGRRFRWAIATGWALGQSFNEFEKSFPLSGHADFKGLIRYVGEVAPKKVYTQHGLAQSLASHLRRLGYDATAVPTSHRQ